MDIKRFKQLLESQLGNVKPLISEQEVEKIIYQRNDIKKEMMDSGLYYWEYGGRFKTEEEAINDVTIRINNTKYDKSHICYIVDKLTDDTYRALAYIHKGSVNGENKGCFNPKNKLEKIIPGSFDDPEFKKLIQLLLPLNPKFYSKEEKIMCDGTSGYFMIEFGSPSTYYLKIDSACGDNPLRFSIRNSEISQEEINNMENDDLARYNSVKDSIKSKYSLDELIRFWETNRYENIGSNEFKIKYITEFYDDLKRFFGMYPIN